MSLSTSPPFTAHREAKHSDSLAWFEVTNKLQTKYALEPLVDIASLSVEDVRERCLKE